MIHLRHVLVALTAVVVTACAKHSGAADDHAGHDSSPRECHDVQRVSATPCSRRRISRREARTRRRGSQNLRGTASG